MLNFVKSRTAGKKLLLPISVILFFHIITFAQEDWTWVNPQPQGNNLRDVFVLDENTIIAVGDRGTLLRSENGGKDWEITYRLSNMDEDIVDIQFISEQKGYLLAYNPSSKIILTKDKGIHWKVITEFDSLKLNDLFFIDENIGWAIGTSGQLGKILKSTDGGYNWVTMFMQDLSTYGGWEFSTIQFIDSTNGWAAGKMGGNYISSGELLKTTDGGLNWDVFSDSMFSIIGFQFLNSNIGWIRELIGCWIGCAYSTKKTTDGGISWEEIFTSGDALYFLNTDTGWVMEGNNIHKTTDGGISWITVIANVPLEGEIHFSNELNGCVVGDYGGILTTEGGGQSWIERSATPFHDPLKFVDFYNESIGWVTFSTWGDYGGHGYEGIGVYKTSNGGVSWVSQEIPHFGRDNWLGDFQVVNDQVVYAAGTEVFKTSDGGTNWSIILYSSLARSLYFFDEETGFLGSEGFVLKTTDGGFQWDTVLAVSAESIFFTNSSMGWLISGHNIYKTLDEGNNWSLIWTINCDLKSIYFKDENVGLAVGNDGVILKSTDGGSNWDEIFNLEGYELKSVCFSDSDKAVVVGRETSDPWITEQIDGIIISVDNVTGLYSISWESWSPGLNDICFNNNIGWAVGDGGTILKTGEGVSIIEEEEIDQTPADFLLSQNYPNPFNSSSVIRYSTPQRSNVTIKVFDILGNEIESLVNEEKQTGNYEITWFAEGLPSGVYFYQLTTVDPSTSSGQVFIQTKKMVLLK